MSPTVIDPSLGEAPLFVGGGVATTTGYGSIDLRRALGVALQEGAVEALAYKVTQRALGANMSVDIDADAGSCVVQGDHVTGQGLYPVPPHSANINELITTADATNPRVDQVVLEVLDNVHDASGGNLVRTRVVAGAPTGDATLDNRSGAAALPSSCMRLADVLVGAGATTITTANIRDRRAWARGAYVRVLRNSNASAGSDYSTTSTGAVEVDSTNLRRRIECSGAPLRATLRGVGSITSAIGSTEVRIDSVAIDGGAFAQEQGDGLYALVLIWDTVPTAGSHLVSPYFFTSSGAAAHVLKAAAGQGLEFVVEEIVKQNASND